MLDFGGQYSQLIARRMRECGVFAELLPHDIDIERSASAAPRALVLSGGPASVYADGAPELRDRAARARDPGARHLLRDAGDGPGARRPGRGRREGEFGRTELELRDGGGRLLAGLPGRAAVLDEPPRHRLRAAAGLRALASSPGSPVAACEGVERGLYGIQFHPEVVHTPHGTEILDRFLREIAGCSEHWSPAR